MRGLDMKDQDFEDFIATPLGQVFGWVVATTEDAQLGSAAVARRVLAAASMLGLPCDTRLEVQVYNSLVQRLGDDTVFLYVWVRGDQADEVHDFHKRYRPAPTKPADHN